MDPELTVTHWIEQLKAGDSSAAQPLWERYFARLARLAERKLRGATGGAVDGEDVVLSAFASFCRAAGEQRFPQLHDREDLWKLLVTITERKALNQVRDQKRLKRGGGLVRGEGGTESRDGLAQVPSPEPTPEFALLLGEEYRALLDALGDDLLRQIAVARMEGYASEEIAARLNIALRTLERKLALIRRIWEERAEG